MKKLLVILICIFAIFTLGGCANASFDVKTVTLDGKIDWYGEGKDAYFPTIRDGCYLDDDGTIVAVWQEDYRSFKEDNREAETRFYLLRISPDGSYTKTLVYDSGLLNLDEVFYFADSSGVFKNARGNTVLLYEVIERNAEDGEEEMDITYIFEEFDYDFNQVKIARYSEPYDSYSQHSFAAMDDNGYLYTGSRLNALVYSPDFEFLGEITGLPELIIYNNPYYVEYFIPVTGGDGAVYIQKYADDEPQGFFKIDPQTLTAKKVFTLSADKTHSIWRGDLREGALFYTSGEIPLNEFGLLKINKNGMATHLMDWEDSGTGIEFSAKELNELYGISDPADFSENGNFYKLNIVDSDGNNETEGDDVIKLISFIRN
ncbi:MAG: hypothetical protein LBM59_01180 [Ruminococcus sp.]|jgi:hypothetical protein|nr:hypothetical protein [Ruminococcus sp.]